ncbi:permease [Leptolyngbya sp. BL0902]|uniref:AEC family transporter n=1 Tax=Leptolyngbya sp. BL0902 TaxID=1115757 RepID=UPI0018E8A103|nr:AEC family transporter [Leptolyngbya sp. BL0902]QQE63835.1 permease [Leptolyngbya sp. BL0902]
MPLFGVLLRLYLPIGAGILAGVGLGQALTYLQVSQAPSQRLYQRFPLALGKFLFWVGIPVSIVGFMRRADLTGAVYVAPMVAWGAMLLGLLVSRLWMTWRGSTWPRPTQGSFSLASMLGNTGYIGFPVVLLLPQLGVGVFSWALFYDVLGTLFGAYGLGAILAAHYSDRPQGLARPAWVDWLLEVIRNPIILAFLAGLALRPVPLPPTLETALQSLSWGVIMLCLLLMGLRLQQIRTWQHLSRAGAATTIKLLIMPLVVGLGLTAIGIDGPPRLVMVLQSGMPSAFANLVLSEAYNLDRELSVTCVGLSSVGLLLTLPLWLWGFAPA